MYGIDLGAGCARIAWLDRQRQPVTADGAVPAVAAAGPWPAGDDDGAVFSLRSRLFATEAGADPALAPPGAFPTSAAALVGAVFTELLRRAEEAGAPEERQVALSLPARASDAQEMALRRAAEAVGLRVAKVVPDPVAVALHHGALRAGTDSTVVVWDQGGAGLRLTVLAVGSDRTVRLVEHAEHPLGGAARDEAVARELLSRLPYDRVTPPLLRTAERLRLRLANAEEVTETVRLDGTDHPVTFDRERLDAVLAPERARAREALTDVLEAARQRTGRWPSGLLLAGGVCSGAPGTAEALAEGLDLPVRSTTPALAVVRGLAMIQDFGLLRIESGPATRPTSHGARPTGPRPTGPREQTAGRKAEPPAPRPDPEPVGADDPEPRSSFVPPATGRFTSGAGHGADDPEPAAPAPVGPADGMLRPPGAGAATGRPHTAGSGRPEDPADPVAVAPPADDEASVPPPRKADDRPAPAREEHGTASPGGDPVGVPVAELQAVRRDDHLLLLWEWPPGSLMARVRWRLEDSAPADGRLREGDVRCSRRVYEHDGGLDLVVGHGGVTLTVEAMVPGAEGGFDPPSSLKVASGLPVVRYEPRVRRRLYGRVASVSFTSETSCRLPALHVVLGRGRYRPEHPADGTVVHVVPPQQIEARSPLVVEFPFPSGQGTRGDAWLVCFPAQPPGEDIDLRPAALHRLKVM